MLSVYNDITSLIEFAVLHGLIYDPTSLLTGKVVLGEYFKHQQLQYKWMIYFD